MSALAGKTVLIIGRGTGIAGAIAQAVLEAGGSVVAAGRSPDALADSFRGNGTHVERVDITDEASVAELASAVGSVDHIVSAASSRARGGYADLTAPLVAASLAAKVIGPLHAAGHRDGRAHGPDQRLPHRRHHPRRRRRTPCLTGW